MRRRRLAGIVATFVVALGMYFVVGRWNASEPRRSLADVRPGDQLTTLAPPFEAAERHAGAERERRSIRVAMSAAFLSGSGLPVYDRIVDYLAKALDRECELATGFSYSTIDAMLEAGAVDVAFVCGLPYVLQHDREQPTVELIAAPVMKAERYKDRPKYFSCVIVHKDSHYRSFVDLKGCTYVYNDELSNSGYNMPRARLVELGKTGGFFDQLLRSGSHEESIRLVAIGQADASSVDSLVLDYDLAKHPEYARQVRVIEVLGPAGIPPVVASTRMPQALRQRIHDILLRMKDDPEGRKILDDALVDRFEAVDDSNYDDIRHMQKMAEEAGFLEIK